MIDHGIAAAAVGTRIAGATHDVSGRLLGSQPVEKREELLPLRRIDLVVGIESERVIAGGVRQRFISRRGEVIDPENKWENKWCRK